MKAIFVVLVVLVAQTLAAPLSKESEDRLRAYFGGLQVLEIPEAVQQLVRDIKSINSHDKTLSDLMYDEDINLDIYGKGLVPEEKKKDLEQACYDLVLKHLFDEQTGDDLGFSGLKFLEDHFNEFPQAMKNAYNVGTCARFLDFLRQSGNLSIKVDDV